jgi:hypothetical protein
MHSLQPSAGNVEARGQGGARVRGGREQGFSIAGVIIALGIGAIIAAGLSQMLGGAFKAQKKVELNDERLALRREIGDMVSCERTLAGVNIAGCNGDPDDASVGPALQLKGIDLHGNTKPLFSSYSSGMYRVGRFGVKVTCSQATSSLLVRVAVYDKNGAFAKDPLTGQTLDFNAKKALVYGVEGARLCSGHFSAPSCEAYIKDFGPSPPAMTLQQAINAGTIRTYQHAVDNGYICDWPRVNDYCQCPAGTVQRGYNLDGCSNGHTIASCVCCDQ